MKDRPIQDKDFISLHQYAMEFHGKNNLDMGAVIAMKEKAFNVPTKKIREKKMLKTPLLQTAQWLKIWNEHYKI